LSKHDKAVLFCRCPLGFCVIDYSIDAKVARIKGNTKPDVRVKPDYPKKRLLVYLRDMVFLGDWVVQVAAENYLAR